MNVSGIISPDPWPATSLAAIVTEGPAAPFRVEVRVILPEGTSARVVKTTLKFTAVPTEPVEGPVRVRVEGEITIVKFPVAEDGA